MATQVDTAQRQIVLVKDARIRPMMGNLVLESLPLAGIPYSMVDPYILVHEATIKITPEQANQDPPNRTAGSTTSGTRSRAPRAPATATVPAAPWSGPSLRKDPS